MISLFSVAAAMIYVGPLRKTTGFEDVVTKRELRERHYAEVDLGSDYVARFIR